MMLCAVLTSSMLVPRRGPSRGRAHRSVHSRPRSTLPRGTARSRYRGGGSGQRVARPPSAVGAERWLRLTRAGLALAQRLKTVENACQRLMGGVRRLGAALQAFREVTAHTRAALWYSQHPRQAQRQVTSLRPPIPSHVPVLPQYPVTSPRPHAQSRPRTPLLTERDMGHVPARTRACLARRGARVQEVLARVGARGTAVTCLRSASALAGRCPPAPPPCSLRYASGPNASQGWQ